MGVDGGTAIVGAAFVGMLATIIGPMIGRQIQSEFQDWTPHVTNRLVDGAANRLPEGKRDRYREEWSSMSTRPLVKSVSGGLLLVAGSQPGKCNPRTQSGTLLIT